MINTHNKFRLASDPDTDVQELKNLTGCENELIRGAVALNPSTTANILVRLFNDDSEHLQKCLGKRNDTKH